MPNLPQSPDIKQNSKEGISYFQISDLCLMKENCHNSRTGSDIDMKLGPVAKLKKRNTATSKKIDDDKMLINCDIIVIFSIYG